jgi:acyl dehydratase
MTRIINGIDELRTLVGQPLGESYWVDVDQPTIDGFADLTHDHNWVHVDRRRAAESPFGQTIAHGYYSLALIGGLIQDVFRIDHIRLGLNYGVQKARLPNAVPVNSRVRLAVTLTDVVDSRTDDGADVFYHCEIEIEGQTKPACAADIIFRYFPEIP